MEYYLYLWDQATDWDDLTSDEQEAARQPDPMTKVDSSRRRRLTATEYEFTPSDDQLGTEFNARIEADNGFATSDPGATFKVFMVKAPIVVDLTESTDDRTTTSLHLTFEALADVNDRGGDAEDSITYTLSEVDGGVSTPLIVFAHDEPLEYTVEDLTLGEYYTFELYASNSRVDGPVDQDIIQLLSEPEDPTNLATTLDCASGELTFTWNEPVSLGGRESDLMVY